MSLLRWKQKVMFADGGVLRDSGGGGGGGGGPQQSTTYTSSLPEYARPYFERGMERTEALSQEGYVPYTGQRLEGFTPRQQELFGETYSMRTPDELRRASYTTGDAASRALGTYYSPGQFSSQYLTPQGLSQFQMDQPFDVGAMRQDTPQMRIARTDFAPQLQQFQMAEPEAFTRSAAEQYMSPYQQSVTDVAKRQAALDALRIQQASNLGAARTGTYGGARQTLAQTEREKALGQQLSDIQIRGSQAAFENAQAQFERDRAARMLSGRENLQAALGVQQLGTQTGLQTALANLSSEQQANVQNLAAQLQTQGLNADQALRAALANQQAGLTTGQQNLAARLGVQQLGATQSLEAQRANQAAFMEAQRAAEQSRQFGAGFGLQGLQTALTGAGQLSQIGKDIQATDLSRLQAQQAVAGAEQTQRQKALDMAYQDFLAQREFPYRQLEFYNAMLRGLPVKADTTSSSYQAQPNVAQQVLGYGIPALALSKAFSAA